MSFFQWRRFNFFEISKDVDSGRLSNELGEDNAVTCATSGRGRIVLGDLKVNKRRPDMRSTLLFILYLSCFFLASAT